MTNPNITRDELGAQHWRAELILIFVTLIWGTSFTYVKLALQDISVFQVIALRFSLSMVLVMGWRVSTVWRSWREHLWYSLVLGLCLFLGYFVQTLGLQYTTAGKSAFITSLLIVFVPIFNFLIAKRIPRKASFLGIGLALVGLYLLTRPKAGQINLGDVYTLLCAIFFALYIVLLQLYSVKARLDTLVFGQFLVVVVLSWFAAGWESGLNMTLSWRVVGVVGYLGIFCTFIAMVLMNRFQKETTATRAALIYTGEPVVAALFAWWILQELMTPVQMIGGAAILAGILIAELF
jgi:drug/metabolite transporter (DMT)-like permease